MTDDFHPSRRGALQCLAFGGASTLFTLSGGILTPIGLAQAATEKPAGVPLFLQVSDTHIGFNKDANPDVAGTLKDTIALVNAMKSRPALTIHTGDITHLSKRGGIRHGFTIADGLARRRTAHRARRT